MIKIHGDFLRFFFRLLKTLMFWMSDFIFFKESRKFLIFLIFLNFVQLTDFRMFQTNLAMAILIFVLEI